ncbi:hypothetical protein [Streptomyces violaceusniger]|uniref:hypothetical protein n=1 Tax=Streptomyces violaceusniger TaxID=68280 RepID=UPI0010F98058
MTEHVGSYPRVRVEGDGRGVVHGLDVLAWMPLLDLTGTTRRWTPRRLRGYRLGRWSDPRRAG